MTPGRWPCIDTACFGSYRGLSPLKWWRSLPVPAQWFLHTCLPEIKQLWITVAWRTGCVESEQNPACSAAFLWSRSTASTSGKEDEKIENTEWYGPQAPFWPAETCSLGPSWNTWLSLHLLSLLRIFGVYFCRLWFGSFFFFPLQLFYLVQSGSSGHA